MGFDMATDHKILAAMSQTEAEIYTNSCVPSVDECQTSEFKCRWHRNSHDIKTSQCVQYCIISLRRKGLTGQAANLGLARVQ